MKRHSWKTLIERARRRLEVATQDYQGCHVPGRCMPAGCSCPCGWCRHDARHVPGGGS